MTVDNPRKCDDFIRSSVVAVRMGKFDVSRWGLREGSWTLEMA